MCNIFIQPDTYNETAYRFNVDTGRLHRVNINVIKSSFNLIEIENKNKIIEMIIKFNDKMILIEGSKDLFILWDVRGGGIYFTIRFGDYFPLDLDEWKGGGSYDMREMIKVWMDV